MQTRGLKQLKLYKQRVLLRVDFSVPLNPDGSIANDYRIEQSLPTIRYLLEQECSIVLISHLQRPQGKQDPKLSLKVCARRLAELLNQEIRFVPDCIGKEVNDEKDKLALKQILMLENLRFYPEEEKTPSPDFAKALSYGADYYVNDAFACCHRKQASTVDVAMLFPKRKAAGLLLEKEIYYYQKYLNQPNKPITAIIGGSKISTKIGILRSLLGKVDTLLIGGAMANTFLIAKGYSLEKSFFEKDYLTMAKEILNECQQKNIQILLPSDLVFTNKIDPKGQINIIQLGDSPPKNQMAVDIGPKTVAQYCERLQKSKVIFWNGPLGVFETEPFAKGTKEIALYLSQSKAVKIVGGGDSVAAIEMLGLKNSFDHLSTGGGASLELIEKGHLPGIDALSD